MQSFFITHPSGDVLSFQETVSSESLHSAHLVASCSNQFFYCILGTVHAQNSMLFYMQDNTQVPQTLQQ